MMLCINIACLSNMYEVGDEYVQYIIVLRLLDIVITRTKSGDHFLRKSRKLFNKMKENFQNDLAVAHAISRHSACSIAFYVNY